MKLRLISIAVMAPLVIWANVASSPIPFQIVVMVMVGLALGEYVRLLLPARERWLVIGLGLLWTGLLIFLDGSEWILGVWAGITFLLVISYMTRRDEPGERWGHLTLALFGINYVCTLMAHTGMIRALPQGTGWVFFLLLGTWFADSAAYVVGHWIGRHKLAPVLSPGKTIEGVIGGIGGSLAVVPLCRYWLFPEIPVMPALGLALGLALLGPLGDLSESLVKRAIRVKDSGTLIPGHGGALDRIDALLFNAPLVYYAVKYFL